MTRVLLQLLVDAAAAGVRLTDARPALPDPAFHAAVAEIRGFAGADLPDDLLGAGLAGWCGLVGSVTLELLRPPRERGRRPRGLVRRHRGPAVPLRRPDR